MKHRMHRALPLLPLAWASCSPATPSPIAPPAALGARCSVGASQTRPLIVEWPASDRMDLEALVRTGGGVVVRYSGCELELLPSCKAPGNYKYVAGTRQDEGISIRDADELFAKLPVGATSLEATVEQGTELRLDMSIVGKYVTTESRLRAQDLKGQQCKGATHVVVGLTAGAFQMAATAKRAVGAGVGLVGGRTSGEKHVLRQGGTTASCDRASPSDSAPPEGCGAFLRLELSPLECPIAQQYVEGKGCVSAGQQSGAQAEQGEDAALATLVTESAYAMLGSLHGDESDPRFEVEFSGDRATHLNAAARAGVGPNPKLQLVVGSIRGWSLTNEPDKAIEVRALFHVLPPDRIRWSGLSVKSERATDERYTIGLFDEAHPAWRAAHEHVLRSFSDPSCTITPRATPQELQAVPLTANQREDLHELVSDHDFSATICGRARSGKAPWRLSESRIYAVFGDAPKSIVLFGVLEPLKDKVKLTDAKVSSIGD